MDKHTIAHILDEMGTLLNLEGENPFKVRAYHNAARALENLEENLERLVAEERLEEIPGIGSHMAEKIETLFRTGKLPAYTKLKKTIPAGVLKLLEVPGLGAKKVKLLREKLKIKTVQDLKKAAVRGKIATLSGFGAKTQKSILDNLAKIKTYAKRMLWWDAVPLVDTLLKAFSSLKAVKKVEIAGSFRRRLETIGDLDILVASSKAREVIDWFTQQPWVSKVTAKGPTKATVRLKQGLQADLRVISEAEFGYAFLYFTGSKEHNIRVRQLANAKGWSLSEYGLEPLDKAHKKTPLKKKNPTEEDIYHFLGLEFIPPELREDRGEIEAARKGKLPHLIEEKDLTGAFHCHTTASDGHNTLEEMVAAAEKLHWKYIGISDHSQSSFQANGMNEEQLLKQIHQIQQLNRSKKFSPYIFSGLECDILTDGKLDFPDSLLKQLDFAIVSVHRSFRMEEKAMTKRLIKAIENPYATMLGHLTGRLLLKREPYALNAAKVIDACIANGKIMELNAHPMRLDMDWRLWIRAAEKGLKCCINPDAHSTTDLRYCAAGINSARKGWLQKENVFNTLPLAKVRAFLKK